MTKEYPCPVCGDEIEVDGNKFRTQCKSCGSLIGIDYDSEFVDGMHRDLTTLHHIDYYDNPI